MANTGMVIPFVGATALDGWLFLNGETLGDVASGADQESITYQGLFELFWDSMSDAQAPVSTGRGASANADWLAGKTLTMPDARGRMILGTGNAPTLTNRVNGVGGGEEAHILAESELAVHGHAMTGASVDAGGGHTHTIDVNDTGTSGSFVGHSSQNLVTNRPTSSNGSHSHGISGSIDDAGNGDAHENMPPFLALNMIVKV